MGLPKGRTNNPGGRPQGSKNKNTVEVREMFAELVSNNIGKLQSDLNEMQPRDRVKAITDIAKFVLPTLKAQDLKLNDERPITEIRRVIIDPENNSVNEY